MKNKPSYEFILGIDISKKHLDICLTNNNKPIFQDQVANTAQGLEMLQEKLKSHKIDFKKILFCCEDTGIYTEPLLLFAEKNKLNLCVETPLTIKKSLGISRESINRYKKMEI